MSKKLEQKQQRRLAEQQRREAQRRAARRGNLITLGIALAVAALVVFLILNEQQQTEAVGVGPDDAACTRIQTHESEGNRHVPENTRVRYATSPPTSGNHYAEPAVADFYSAPVPPEQLVHNLEHGQIVIWYREDAPEETIDDIEAIVDQEPSATLATPYDDIEEPYDLVLTAWGASQSCERVSQEVVDDFRARFQGRGPERIPGIDVFEEGDEGDG